MYKLNFLSRTGITINLYNLIELTHLIKYISSSFALTYVPYFEGFGIPLVESMRCGVPILSGDKTSLPEIAGDAAIYCDPFNINEISEGMSRMFKEEDLRLRLSENGLRRSKFFSWDMTAQEVWKVIDAEIQQLS
jgi:glycosyltransferase involved in cell wall biosynthesis